MPVEAADLEAAAASYAETLRQVAGSPAVLDLVHLGLGPDGHTASLVPGDPVLEVNDADVALPGPYQGRRRMTLTYPILNRARRVLWLVTGSREGRDAGAPARRRSLDSGRAGQAGPCARLGGPRGCSEGATMTDPQMDLMSINTIRTLSIDAVQAANSGHPGTPMALAPLVYTLWNRVMHFDPQDPIWPNRDRFVLSNGHASMLLWSVLYLTGTKAVNADYERLGQPAVTLDDIRRFRQLGSNAPGHPEYHLVSGVETTTGPLGQGIATSVGMAMAQKWLANRYNRPGLRDLRLRHLRRMR